MIAQLLDRILLDSFDGSGSVRTVAAVYSFEAAELSELIGAVNKLDSSVIPLLARPQGGVAASSRKFRAATEADAAGVVFHLFSSENHPGLGISGGFAIIFGSLGHPSLR